MKYYYTVTLTRALFIRTLTIMIPALADANWKRIHSYVLGPQMPSRSPGLRPTARRPAATLSTCTEMILAGWAERTTQTSNGRHSHLVGTVRRFCECHPAGRSRPRGRASAGPRSPESGWQCGGAGRPRRCHGRSCWSEWVGWEECLHGVTWTWGHRVRVKCFCSWLGWVSDWAGVVANRGLMYGQRRQQSPHSNCDQLSTDVISNRKTVK